jgi:hypothetical protein
MRFIFLAAFAAIMLGLAAITMGNAVPAGPLGALYQSGQRPTPI